MEENIVVTQEKGTKEKCYRIIQEIAVARDKHCQAPFCYQPADCGHHTFKRDRLATAFNPDVVIGMCTQHHTGFCHNKPKQFKEFMINRLGEERYYALRRQSYTNVDHPDYNEIYQGLVKVLRAYRRGA